MDFLKIAETIVLPEFTWVWCFAIAAYAGFWILMFATKAMVTAWLLRKVPRRILKISGEEPVGERLQVFEKEFLKYGVLSESWQEFKKTFVLAKDDGEGVRDAARSQRTPLFGVKAVKSAKNFFTEDLILHKVINVRAMQGVSGQLTGLGILGTFVGLAAGVFLAQGQLFEANLDTMHQGLVRLLSGASLAFWTSVVGILSSLVFSRFESGLMQLLSKRLRGFAYQLDRMFSVEPVEMMSHDQLMEQKGQTKLLEQIAADIHCMTTDHIQLNERLMVQMIQEFKRLLTHEAKREIEAVIDGLREVKEGLRGATNIFKDTQTGYCEATKVGSEMMSRSVLNLTGTLDHFSRRTMEHVSQTKEVTDDLKDLFSRVAPEFESTVNQLGKLNQNLKNFHGDMNSNQDKVQKTMKGIVENFDMVGNKFRDLLHTDVFSTIKNFVSVMDQTTKSTVDRIDNAAVVATKNLKSPIDQFTRGVALFVKTSVASRRHLDELELKLAEKSECKEKPEISDTAPVIDEYQSLKQKWAEFSKQYFAQKREDPEVLKPQKIPESQADRLVSKKHHEDVREIMDATAELIEASEESPEERHVHNPQFDKHKEKQSGFRITGQVRRHF